MRLKIIVPFFESDETIFNVFILDFFGWLFLSELILFVPCYKFCRIENPSNFADETQLMSVIAWLYPIDWTRTKKNVATHLLYMMKQKWCRQTSMQNWPTKMSVTKKKIIMTGRKKRRHKMSEHRRRQNIDRDEKGVFDNIAKLSWRC